MTCELSPYSCMPNTMSQGAMANVLGSYPDLLYAPIEIKGDAEVHALSRCQMILTEAKKRAQSEFVEAMAKTGMTLEKLRADRGEASRSEEGDLSRSASGLRVHGGELRAASRRAQSRRDRLSRDDSITRRLASDRAAGSNSSEQLRSPHG